MAYYLFLPLLTPFHRYAKNPKKSPKTRPPINLYLLLSTFLNSLRIHHPTHTAGTHTAAPPAPARHIRNIT